MSQSKRPNRRETASCPFCGKQPKIKIENRMAIGAGCWVTIECKKWYLRKPHLFVDIGRSTYERALITAISEWNKMVKEISDE